MRIFGLNIGKDNAADYHQSTPGSEERRAAHKEMHTEDDGGEWREAQQPEPPAEWYEPQQSELAAERAAASSARLNELERQWAEIGRDVFGRPLGAGAMLWHEPGSARTQREP